MPKMAIGALIVIAGKFQFVWNTKTVIPEHPSPSSRNTLPRHPGRPNRPIRDLRQDVVELLITVTVALGGPG